MIPFDAVDVLRVIVGMPLALALPGFLLLVPLTPGWGALQRVVVGIPLTITTLGLAIWGLSTAGVPLDAPLVRSLWLGLAALGSVAAWLAWRGGERLAPGRPGREHLILAAILVLAIALAYAPRWGDGLPIHVDEWWPLDAAKAMAAQQTVDFVEPRLGLWTLEQNPEVGFHVFVVALQLLLGADWLALFHVGPVVLVAALVVGVWCCARREGYAAEAALMAALLPTSVRVLGPQFFVPLALGLVFIPSTFLLFTAGRPARALPIVALLIVFLFFTHPQSAAATGIMIGTYAFVTLLRRPIRAALLLALAALPFVLGLLLLKEHGVDPSRLLEARSPLPVPEFVLLFGLLPSALFLAGAFVTFLKPSPERLAWVFTSFVHLLLVTLFIVWGIGHPNLYDRAWMHGMLTMAVTAGYALYRIRTTTWLPTRWARPVAALSIVALVVLAGTAQAGRSEGYYTVVDDQQYADMVWVAEHVDANGSRALVDPWLGTAFNALAGHKVVASSTFGIGSPRYNSSDFRGLNNRVAVERALDQNATNERLLQRWNVTLIYTDGGVENENFTQVHPRVWVRNNVSVRP